jgi:ribosomal protein S18 acetylase RimI-like enzyme
MEGIVVREGVSKAGTPYAIRYPKSNDAESVWKYANRLSQERTFVRFQGEEISLDKEIEVVGKWMRAIEAKEEIVLFLEIAGDIQGISSLEMDSKTEAHIGTLGLSVDQSVRGQGLGELLMSTVMDEAKSRIARLELFILSVKEPNEVAIALYKKLGFMEYGNLPNGTTHGGKRVGSLFMYKAVER